MCFYHQVTRLQHPFLSENFSSFCQPSSTFQLTLHFTYCHFSSIFRPTTSYCGCPNFYSCTIHISENFGQTNTLNSLLFLAKLIWWQMQLTIQFICAATVIIFAYHQLPFLLEISIWIYFFLLGSGFWAAEISLCLALFFGDTCNWLVRSVCAATAIISRLPPIAFSPHIINAIIPHAWFGSCSSRRPLFSSVLSKWDWGCIFSSYSFWFGLCLHPFAVRSCFPSSLGSVSARWYFIRFNNFSIQAC